MTQRKTALITGASVGLGKEFAELFARDGHDVVLVARSADALGRVAAELQKTHGITAHSMPLDLSRPTACDELYRSLKERGVVVDFLVNNAGFGSNGPFLDQDLTKEVAMVDLNVSTLMRLCHLFGREMRERRGGRILNIASSAGFQAGPFMATYYATKAFVIMFSEALAFELKPSGVTVTCHCPGATATEFAQRAGNANTRLFQRASSVAKASEVAEHAYRAMQQGKVLAVHGAMNKVGVFFTRLIPRQTVSGIAAELNKPLS